VSEHGHPPLDDRERGLLAYLAIRTICAQTGDSEQATADVLDEFAADGLVSIYRNATDCYLCVRDQDGEDHVIVHAERDWLSWMAHRPTGAPAMN
jgi:hypothetical protein